MKKGGFLRNVLDTIRSNQTNQTGQSTGLGSPGASRNAEFGGLLKPQHFSLAQVARHGFPEQPTALAFDPVQKIAAIGTRTGALRVFGRPGVDVWAQHKPEYAITHIKFVVNQGAIITVTSDESIHLWSLRGSSLKLQLSANSGSSPSSSSLLASSPASSSSTLTGNQQQQQQVGGQSGANLAFQSAAAAAILNSDSGAQPGDPDYLAGAEQLVGGAGNEGSSSIGGPAKSRQSRQPELLHTLKFQREHITCLHQTLMSKWLYIGTEKGNVHVANIETFELSGYQIAWNKAIELSRKTHPGAIIHLSECPQDSNKLLLGYESGCIVLWDLKNKSADGRYYQTENLLWLAWHYEGKQFVAAHSDGSLVTWQTRSNARPTQTLQPHAKASTPSPHPISASAHEPTSAAGFHQQPLQQQENALSYQQSSLARALNNEFYQPILKVDWRTSKNNEQFLLFSGGLPYDGLASRPTTGSEPAETASSAPSPRPPISTSSAPQQSSNTHNNEQYLKAGTAPTLPSSPSPSVSPAVLGGRQSAFSPNSHQTKVAVGRQQQLTQFRPTSLTVMCGKSITVLEMDDLIIDFITVCDNSPYDNDASDPYAIIVLLANDLILIDLTSSGYPSFESPYPATQLNESPVTCVQYLADCSSDLIPYLYSTSKNFISRAPKKGFSDKEWPINGGEWGQSMQSYPELVLTGHSDGTIKFWDMSGVNFDLISKLKTSKLFERPSRLARSLIVPFNSPAAQVVALRAGYHESSTATSPPAEVDSQLLLSNLANQQNSLEENLFAVEKIEYCSSSKRLLVAGANSQVIQFKLSKPQSVHSGPAASSSSASELTTILVEQVSCGQLKQSQQQHLIFKTRNPNSCVASSSSSSDPAAAARSSNRTKRTSSTSGFQPELICLTPMQVLNFRHHDEPDCANSCYCIAPPKVTAIALQVNHNM